MVLHLLTNTNRKSRCIYKIGVHIRLNSRLEIGDDASSIVNVEYHIAGDYCIRRYSEAGI